ncbi:MAG: hypothetical protein U0795_22055 [Pirellulales bacterium]
MAEATSSQTTADKPVRLWDTVQQDLDDRMLEQSVPSGQLAECFQAIEAYDRRFEPLDRTWKVIKIIAGVATLFSLPIAFGTAGAGLVLTIPLAIFFVAALILHSKYAAGNLPDRRYRVPAEALKFLSVDMHPEAPVLMKINFRPYQHKDYLTGKERDATDYQVTNYSYEQPWLQLQGKLLDGSKFRLRVATDVKRKQKQKRKRVKVTETFREKLDLTLTVSPEMYPGLERFPELLNQAPKPANLERLSARAEGHQVVIDALSRSLKSSLYSQADETTDHHTVLQLFLATYECLRQCRTA